MYSLFHALPFRSALFSGLCFIALSVSAQEEQAWYDEDEEAGTIAISIGLGYYFTGDATAQFYNGEDNGRLNLLLSQPQIQSQIQDEFNGADYELAEFAQDMRYNNSLAFSLGLDYRLRNDWQLSAYFNQVRLQAAGIFTFRVNRRNQNNQLEPFIEQVSIGGEERRSQIQLAVGKRIFFSDNLYMLAEGGVDATIVEPQQNQFEIGRVYTLPITTQNNGVANNPLSTGFGIMLGAGVGYELPATYGFLLKFTYVNTEINLNDVVEERLNMFMPTLAFTKAF